MERHFSIVKSERNGEIKYFFNSSLGPPQLEKNQQVVLYEKTEQLNPSYEVKSGIFLKLRRRARENDIPFVANLDHH